MKIQCLANRMIQMDSEDKPKAPSMRNFPKMNIKLSKAKTKAEQSRTSSLSITILSNKMILKVQIYNIKKKNLTKNRLNKKL